MIVERQQLGAGVGDAGPGIGRQGHAVIEDVIGEGQDDLAQDLRVRRVGVVAEGRIDEHGEHASRVVR